MGLGRGVFCGGDVAQSVFGWRRTLYSRCRAFIGSRDMFCMYRGGGAVSQRTHMDEDTLKARQHARE